jgi:hypothetical protein
MPGATELDRNNHSRPLGDYYSSIAVAAIVLSPALMVYENKVLSLCVFAPLRESGLLIQAAVLAKAQRRKGCRIYFSKTISPTLAHYRHDSATAAK